MQHQPHAGVPEDEAGGPAVPRRRSHPARRHPGYRRPRRLDTLDENLLERLSVKDITEADAEFRITVGPHRRGTNAEPFEAAEFSVRGSRQQELAIAVELDGQLREGSALVVVAEEVSDEEVLGGVGAVILGSRDVEGNR